MKKFTLLLSLIALTVAVSIPAKAQKFGKRPPPPIEVAKVVKRELLEKLNLFGNIKAGNSATVRAEVLGTIVSFKKEVGDKLKTGETVSSIDPESYRITLNIAQSALRRSEASLEIAKLNQERIAKLHQKGVVSLEKLQESKLEGEIKKAEMAQKKAEVKRARRDLRLASIRAPYSGYIASKYIQKGDFVRAGDPVFDIVSLSSVYANVVVPEKNLGSMRIKSKATLWLDAYPGVLFSGTVTRISPRASIKSRDFAVRIDFRDKKGIARDGMFVRVEIIPNRKMVLMVPKDAIVERGQMKIVFRINESKAQQVTVKALHQSGNMVEVEADLKEGDELAVTGNEILRDGAAVNVTLRR